MPEKPEFNPSPAFSQCWAYLKLLSLRELEVMEKHIRSQIENKQSLTPGHRQIGTVSFGGGRKKK